MSDEPTFGGRPNEIKAKVTLHQNCKLGILHPVALQYVTYAFVKTLSMRPKNNLCHYFTFL